MTNLEIIKYLATNNPTRLAELIDDIYCCGWNCGAYTQREDNISELEMEFLDGNWIDQEADKNFFFDHELEEWSKTINSPHAIEACYDNLSVTLPVTDPDHMWNNNNEYTWRNTNE